MKLLLRLHGPFMAFWADRRRCRVPGIKQQALLALLVTAPEYARTRSWLIARLWSESDETQGRRNLRQLLHGLRTTFADHYADIMRAEGDLIYLRSENVGISGSPADGEFLEGFDLFEEGFEDWLREQRQATAARPIGPSNGRVPASDMRVRHRIAVMPFKEAGTIEAGFGDMAAQLLSVALARSGLVDAISHLSSRQIAVEPAEGATDADFRLFGRCHGSGSTVTIYATLEDLADGSVLWGDRFCEDRNALISGDGDLIDQVAGQCLWQIAKQSTQLSLVRPLGNASAHVLMMNGIVQMHSFDPDRFAEARVSLEEVAARCPNSTLPLAWLAQWHLLSTYQGWSEDPNRTRREATDATARALDLNPCCELSLAIDGNLQNVLARDFSTAAQRFAAARAINPSSAMINQLSAVLSCFTGKGEEAVTLTERARRLAPRDPRRAFFAGIGASSYLVASRWVEAVAEAEASLCVNPGHVSAMRCRVIGLQRSGRDEEASAAARALMAVCPEFSVSAYLRDHPAAETSVGRDWARALGEAGVRMN